MAQGGARPGAGRRPGVATKIDNELRKRALEGDGETPLEYMLRVMRDETADDPRRDGMAIAAAPYLHARLTTVKHTGAEGGPVQFQVVRYADGPKVLDVQSIDGKLVMPGNGEPSAK